MNGIILFAPVVDRLDLVTSARVHSYWGWFGYFAGFVAGFLSGWRGISDLFSSTGEAGGGTGEVFGLILVIVHVDRWARSVNSCRTYVSPVKRCL